MKTTVTFTWGGFGLFVLTSLILMILRLCGVIEMPWVWIFSFIWIPAALFTLFFAIIALSFTIPLIKGRMKR